MTRRRRWSEHLEAQRGGAEAAARESVDRLEQAERVALAARSVILNNPALAERYLIDLMILIGQAGVRQERIIRLMLEAAQGLKDAPRADHP